MREILSIKVYVDQAFQVKGEHEDVCMILFHGDAHNEYFNGDILPGGVDTQKFPKGSQGKLSARYILKGKDDKQKDCQIFIENNGEVDVSTGKITTTPRIVTDSESLKWMEEAELTGTVCGEEGYLRISIFEK